MNKGSAKVELSPFQAWERESQKAMLRLEALEVHALEEYRVVVGYSPSLVFSNDIGGIGTRSERKEPVHCFGAKQQQRELRDFHRSLQVTLQPVLGIPNRDHGHDHLFQ